MIDDDDIVDTESADASAFGDAAAVDPAQGEAACVHVTDDPTPVVRALEAGLPLDTTYQGAGDLGAGLYCSAVPERWLNRSRGKWDFLSRLDRAQRVSLVRAILASRQFRERGYLTTWERARAVRDLRRWMDNPELHYAVVYVSEQPYNVPVWRPEFLRPLGIGEGRQPKRVPVSLKGRFLRVRRSSLSAEEVQAIRQARSDIDGLFSPGDWINPAQLVVWHNHAVRRFGHGRVPTERTR